MALRHLIYLRFLLKHPNTELMGRVSDEVRGHRLRLLPQRSSGEPLDEWKPLEDTLIQVDAIAKDFSLEARCCSKGKKC